MLPEDHLYDFVIQQLALALTTNKVRGFWVLGKVSLISRKLHK